MILSHPGRSVIDGVVKSSILFSDRLHSVLQPERFQITVIPDKHDLLKFSGTDVLESHDTLPVANAAFHDRYLILLVIRCFLDLRLFLKHISPRSLNMAKPGPSRNRRNEIRNCEKAFCTVPGIFTVTIYSSEYYRDLPASRRCWCSPS